MTGQRLRHVAFIMDGNRRWAQRHAAGSLYNDQAVAAIMEAVIACKARSVQYISLYAYSLENFSQRDEILRSFVFKALINACTNKQNLFLEHGIRVEFIGVRSLYSDDVRVAIEQLEQATKAENAITMQILFCYGSQQEIADAASRIASDVTTGLIKIAAITPELFSTYLWTHTVPAPDLIVRTGNASRLSNFLLYQAAYSELIFLECMWPELTRAMVAECIDRFYKASRNFGV